MNQTLIQDVVSEVMRQLDSRQPATRAPAKPLATQNDAHQFNRPSGQFGIFANVNDGVSAATESQKKLMNLSLDDRDDIVKLIKTTVKGKAEEWGKLEFEETKIGRLDHKIEKLQILELVPGVEFLKTYADSGTNGICLEEYAPFGVIGAITPVTHSVPTLTANAINMVAAGNAVVFNAHPSGVRCAATAVREYNRLIAHKYGIEHLLVCIVPPTLESAEAIFQHRGISLLVVTGGPGVARAALAAKKRAIIGGPGNPPVVVDETACLSNAATSIVKGAAYDNNLLCIGEKQVFCVESVFDNLMQKMTQAGAFILNEQQITALTKTVFKVNNEGHAHLNKEFVGKDAAVLAQAINLRVPPTTQLLIGETEFKHPFVQEEQMMPFVPFVRTKNVDDAIDLAIESEHGFHHTALIHSRNVDNITRFGRQANVTLFVANGPSMAGLGLGGQGYLSYSIATPTGEGITTPLTFTRYRRIMMTGSMRMI